MKMPTAWHQGCLKSTILSVDRKRCEVNRMIAELSRDEEMLQFYIDQVETALSRGMDGFDAERFLVKRTPKPDKSK